MQLRRKPLTGEIKHPTFPELVVTTRRLDFVEAASVQSLFRTSRQYRVVYGEGGVPLRQRNSDGVEEVVTKEDSDLPASAILEALKKIVVDVKGLQDERGDDWKFEGDDREKILRGLGDTQFFVDVKDADGKSTPMSFYVYVLQRANDPKTYGLDPSGPTSAGK